MVELSTADRPVGDSISPRGFLVALIDIIDQRPRSSVVERIPSKNEVVGAIPSEGIFFLRKRITKTSFACAKAVSARDANTDGLFERFLEFA